MDPNSEAGRQAGEAGEHTMNDYRLRWSKGDQRPGERGYGKDKMVFQGTVQDNTGK